MSYKILSGIKCAAFAFILVVAVQAGSPRPIYDFDGDGRTDPIVQRFSGVNTQLQWYALGSSDGFAVRNWGYQFAQGVAGDQACWGDFDGDRKWDVCVARRVPGQFSPMIWYVLNSSDGSMTARHWGLTQDILVPQDYDGDGKTDFAVFREGWWYILRSSDGQFYAEKFGTSSLPFMGGDYDGDGKDDLAVLQDGLWIRYSATGWWRHYAIGSRQITGIVAGDYDGDGKADVAIWQGNMWLWERSSDGQLGGGLRFGITGFIDTPVPGDYDGDGKTDIAVFRNELPDYFYIQQSRDGFVGIPWGRGDANVFDRRYIPPTGFRPASAGKPEIEDEGPFPRLIATGKN